MKSDETMMKSDNCKVINTDRPVGRREPRPTLCSISSTDLITFLIMFYISSPTTIKEDVSIRQRGCINSYISSYYRALPIETRDSGQKQIKIVTSFKSDDQSLDLFTALKTRPYIQIVKISDDLSIKII